MNQPNIYHFLTAPSRLIIAHCPRQDLWKMLQTNANFLDKDR